MPVRKSEEIETPEEPQAPKEKIRAKGEAVDPVVLELAIMGAEYVRLKKDETKIGTEIDKKKVLIKDKFKEAPFEINGNHKEITAPMGDGLNEVFIQVQLAESTKMVDNVVDLVKKKLGSNANNFIMTQEVLHSNALEAMLNQGLINNDDVLDWTKTTQVERLIVKINKKKK